jgi:tetrahydromethanopterin S-methyltransferase subunit F
MSDERLPEGGADALGEGRRKRLRRLSHRAAWLTLGGVALAIVYSVYLPFDREALLAYLRRDVPGPFVMPPENRLWLAYGIGLVPFAAFVAAMWEARRFFMVLARARIFDPAVPPIVARLGGLAIGIAIAEIIVRPLVVLVMTSANPDGQQQLVIGVSTTDIASLIIGLLFYAFALVMREALAIEDENRSIV